MNSIYYISVESRKGGVGKTTVALSLAQCLIKRNYKVLLLDLDFSGTKLSDAFIEANDFIQRITYKGKPQNLIELYKDQFLKDCLSLDLYLMIVLLGVFAQTRKNVII